MTKLHNTAALLAVLLLSGCGTLQKYHQSLDAQRQAYDRQQQVLDEQNQIQVGNLKAQQRQQEIAAARAEGQKSQAQAQGEAAAVVEKAKGDAQAAVEQARGEAQATILNANAQAKANIELARTLSPLLVQENMVEKLSDKSIIYLPSNTLPYMNVVSPGGLPSNTGR